MRKLKRKREKRLKWMCWYRLHLMNWIQIDDCFGGGVAGAIGDDVAAAVAGDGGRNLVVGCCGDGY